MPSRIRTLIKYISVYYLPSSRLLNERTECLFLTIIPAQEPRQRSCRHPACTLASWDALIFLSTLASRKPTLFGATRKATFWVIQSPARCHKVLKSACPQGRDLVQLFCPESVGIINPMRQQPNKDHGFDTLFETSKSLSPN